MPSIVTAVEKAAQETICAGVYRQTIAIELPHEQKAEVKVTIFS